MSSISEPATCQEQGPWPGGHDYDDGPPRKKLKIPGRPITDKDVGPLTNGDDQEEVE